MIVVCFSSLPLLFSSAMICGYLYCCTSIPFCDCIYCSLWLSQIFDTAVYIYKGFFFKLLVSDFRMHFPFPAFHSSSLIITDFGVIFVCWWFPTVTVCFSLPALQFVIFLFLVVASFLFFLLYRCSFSICSKLGLVVLNSLCFCSSVKLLIPLPTLNESLVV